MSESDADRELREKEESWKEKQRKKREITVDVNTEGIEALITRIKTLEPNSRAFDDLKQSLVRQCERVGLTIDSAQIKTAEDFRDTVQKMYDAQEKGEGIPINLEKKGGEGQVPLNMQSGTSRKEFDSIEEMLDDLRSRASAKTQEGEEAQAILDELFRKGLRGQTETKSAFKETEYHGERKPSGKEKGIVETLNEEFRKRRKERKQHEERKE